MVVCGNTAATSGGERVEDDGSFGSSSPPTTPFEEGAIDVIRSRLVGTTNARILLLSTTLVEQK